MGPGSADPRPSRFLNCTTPLPRQPAHPRRANRRAPQPRIIGASLADWLGMDRPLDIGVGFGTTAILAALVCAALVGYLALSHPRAAHDTPGLSPATLP